MSNADIAHIKNAHLTKNDAEFHSMVDGGRYADAAEYLLKRAIGGEVWRCCRRLAGLPADTDAWAEEAGKIAAARKAKHAKR
jgi:hypothetical protein